MTEALFTFTLRLVEHITDEMGDIEYISEEVLESVIDDRLIQIADHIWEEYKDRIE